MTYGETTVSETISRLLRDHPDVDASADGALDGLDQFHIGGADATGLLIGSLALTGGDRVLDVGSGFGGPARQLARTTGSRVTGIDITPAYVAAARDLSSTAGLSDRTKFRVADIATFDPDRPFQAAITMHVQMNVADKVTWFGHIARCLAPGARLAVWEVCQPGPARQARQPGQPSHDSHPGQAGLAPLSWPMPWSLDGSDSFVVGSGALRTSIEQAGFATAEWVDETAWARSWLAGVTTNARASGPALPMLLDDGYPRIINYAIALGNGSLQVWRGLFTRSGQLP